ncbi:MAG: hypothetical protein M3238_01715 [Actinomycetota bacterium]|nr:hypothetical protein [Actinomycetota bacterium]
MKVRGLIRLPLVLLGTITLVSALTASNTVPQSRLGNPSDPVTADKLKPSQCSVLTLSGVVAGSGTFAASNANDLVLAGPGADRPDGRGGNDCILGGGGNDTITGGTGTDICLGGPGSDSFSGCEASVQ